VLIGPDGEVIGKYRKVWGCNPEQGAQLARDLEHSIAGNVTANRPARRRS
jgi:predicted amidohydrolase